MAHLNVAFDFNSASEEGDGTGWHVVNWLDDGSGSGNFIYTENNYTTITAALGAIEELFSSDPEVDKFFYDKAVAQVLGTNTSAVDTAKTTLRVADGLDPTTA
jgi:hypothetical protein